MGIKVIMHVAGEDPILGEIESMPQSTDTFLKVSKVRRVDGKAVAYLTAGVKTVIFPWHRITFVEFMDEEGEKDDVIDFFRL